MAEDVWRKTFSGFIPLLKIASPEFFDNISKAIKARAISKNDSKTGGNFQYVFRFK